jgi:hypothetical protein
LPVTNGYQTAGNKADGGPFRSNQDNSAESDGYLPGKGARVSHPHTLRSITPDVQPESNQMQNLSPRHVKTEEALRLGVMSGWYSTKVSGTFVSGPHESEADCLGRIAEINPPPKKLKR